MAGLIIGQLILGLKLGSLQPGLASLWLYGLHKTIGFIALALVAIRLIWHHFSPPPRPLGPADVSTNRLAIGVHRTAYALLVAIPLFGWVASSATGIDILFADRWVVPPIAPVSESLDYWGFVLHGLLAKALMVLLVLHVLGALRRALAGDGTMARMLRG